MKPLRSLLSLAAVSLCATGIAFAQNEDDFEDRLEGAAPVVSEKYSGRSDKRSESDRADQEATQHRGDRRDRDRRYNDRRYNDRRYTDRRQPSYRNDPYGRGGYGQQNSSQYQTLYCRARGDFGGRRFCAAPRGADRIYFDRRRSDSPCRQGRDYGIDRGGVWVDNGCRADFTVVYYHRGGYGSTDRYGRNDDWYGRNDRYGRDDRYGRGAYEPEYVSCESKDRRYRTCRLPTGYKNVEIVRQRSDASCRRGSDWGLARGGVWVDNGCRATFAVTFDRGRRYSGGW